MTASLTSMPLGELLKRLNSRELNSVELTTACLDAIGRRDDHIHAFLHVDRDEAIRQAESVDQKRASGQSVGLLGGIPVATKDVLCTKGQPTTCGSRMLKNYIPPYDSHAVSRLRNADAVLIGRTNMDEFAMGSSGENSAFGPTRNPWDTDRIPGGPAVDRRRLSQLEWLPWRWEAIRAVQSGSQPGYAASSG